MAERIKIAICISGQTRHFNKKKQYTDDFNKILSLFDEYDYDLFGHTWADQEDPHPEVLNRFTEYRSDPQSIIWDTIANPDAHINKINIHMSNPQHKHHWTEFLQMRREWMQKSEYLDILNSKSDKSFIDFAKERINGALGQTWSAHESFLLTQKDVLTSNARKLVDNDYKFVVKLRWDSMINLYHGHEYTEKTINIFKDNVYNWSHEKYEFSKDFHVDNPTCLCTNDMICEWEQYPWSNDHIYLFDYKCLKKYVLEYSPYEMYLQLLNRLSGVDYNVPWIPSAHTLWMQWILCAGFRVSPLLPNFLQANGPNEDKINKEWNI